MVHPEKIGKRTRMSFARINDIMELPYLIETQKSSYRWFLDKGLKEVFDDINPIVDYSGNMFLEFVDSPSTANRNMKLRNARNATPTTQHP